MDIQYTKLEHGITPTELEQKAIDKAHKEYSPLVVCRIARSLGQYNPVKLGMVDPKIDNAQGIIWHEVRVDAY